MSCVNVLRACRRAVLVAVGAAFTLAGPVIAQQQYEQEVPCTEVEPLRLQYGDHTTGCAISPPADADVFTFVGGAGDLVWISVTTTSPGMDPIITLLDPSGATVATGSCDAGCCAGCVFITQPAAALTRAGVYTIRLLDQGVDESGSYILQLERLPSPRAVTLGFATPVTSDLTPLTDVDWFSFDARANAHVQIVVRGLTGGLDPELILYGPSGQQLTSMFCDAGCCSTCNVVLDTTLTTAGVYFVALHDLRADEAGSYEITLNCVFGDCSYVPPNDDCASPLPISAGRRLFSTRGASTDGPLVGTCGNGEVGSDVWYRFQATCSGGLVVSTLGDANFNTMVAIYSGDGCEQNTGPLLACSDDFGGCNGTTSRAVAYVTAGQVCLIRIGGRDGEQGSGMLTVDNHALSDWNKDCFINSQDYFDFLSDFLGGWADFNHTCTNDSQDFFDFIAAFFSGQ
ncbi:MAG: PPC domain-containing protein [Phycisphaerales bacterium]